MFDWKNKRVIVTGGAGFVGRVLCAKLRSRGVIDENIFVPRRPRNNKQGFDLTEKKDCAELLNRAFPEPDIIFHLAAEVGGIGANRDNPGRFFYANMAMALNLIEQARVTGLGECGGKFIQVGTICAYPKFTPVPFREDDLWEGYPEETNAPYGIAKKAAMVMLDGYQQQYGMKSAYVLPVNLYGPYDNFDLHTSHVIPALIRKCVEAQQNNKEYIEVWGTGSASREFLYVDDAAEGIIRAAEVMEKPVPVNLGTNREITIRDLVALIVRLTGFTGEIRWDTSKPDGQPRRCLDTSRAEKLLGWKAEVGFEDGLKRTIDWFRKNEAEKSVALS